MPDKLWEEPLRVYGDGSTAIEDAAGREIADCLSLSHPLKDDQSRARELVRRANAYPRLVAACKEVEKLAMDLLSSPTKPVRAGLTNHQAAVRGVATMFREKIAAALADE